MQAEAARKELVEANLAIVGSRLCAQGKYTTTPRGLARFLD